MKIKALVVSLFVCLAAQAQSTFINHRLNFVGNSASTNLAIGTNILFRIVSAWGLNVTSGTFGVQFPGGPMMTSDFATVETTLEAEPVLGPCTVQLTFQGANNPASYVTAQYEVVNTTLPAQGVIVQPAGSGAVINLETSTNLTTWASATNGVYARTNLNRFFRMSLTLQ